MLLECSLCAHRPDPESVLEAFQLHCQVEHDTDEVALNLVAACECGATMTFVRTAQVGGTKTVLDYFRCEPCGLTGHVQRGAK